MVYNISGAKKDEPSTEKTMKIQLKKRIDMARFVYADNAATTAVSPEVIAAMQPCFEQAWGNPSSLHAKGREAKAMLDGARASIAKTLGCQPNEIYFTSGGTESDNWAIKGAARRQRAKGRTHIVTSAIEHHAVLNTCEALEREGFDVTYVGVDQYGTVKLDEERKAAMVSNLLVVLCGNRDATPVVNSGSLY